MSGIFASVALAHTVLAAGGINAALGTRDPEDSWQQHFADTQPVLPVPAELQPWLSDENALDPRGRLLE